MKAIEYIAEVTQDGHLSLPNEVREKLGLNPPCSVKVTLTVETELPADEQKGWDVFRRLGQDAVSGKLESPSTKHDQYLYGNKA